MEKRDHLLDSIEGKKNQNPKARFMLHFTVLASLWLLVRSPGPLRVHREHCNMSHLLLRDSMSSWLRIRLKINLFLSCFQKSSSSPEHWPPCLLNFAGLCPECAPFTGGLCSTIWTALWYQRGMGNTVACRKLHFMGCQVGSLDTFSFTWFFSAIAVLTDWAGISILPRLELCWKIKQDPSHLFPCRLKNVSWWQISI